MEQPKIDPEITAGAVERAAAHVRDILAHAIELAPERAAVVVSDGHCGLSRLLAAAYRAALLSSTKPVDTDHLTATLAALIANARQDIGT